MNPKVFFIAVVFAVLNIKAAAAAPLWIERQFVPDTELIDPIFAEYDDASVKVMDHQVWTTFLERRLAADDNGINRIDYGGATATERRLLQSYIEMLETIDVTALPRNEQLAFWINLYNAATVKLILDHYPTDSIRDISAPWKTPVATVNGVELTLNDIEHGIIRPVFKDPRIHYGVNCAALGCPNLRGEAYEGASVYTALDEQARKFINHPRGVRIDDDKLIVSKIFGWFREDFGDTEENILDHIRQFADAPLLRVLEGRTDIDRYKYDWTLNDAATIEADQARRSSRGDFNQTGR